jgi:hypothetical protein
VKTQSLNAQNPTTVAYRDERQGMRARRSSAH